MRKIYVDDKVRAAADDYAANVFKNRRADFQQPLDLLKKFRDNILSTQDTTQGKVLLAYVDRILAVHFDLLHAEPKQMNMLIHEFNTILQVKGKTEKDKNAQTESLMKTRIQYQKSPKKSETHLFYEWIVEAMRYDDVSSQIIPYLNRINIRVSVMKRFLSWIISIQNRFILSCVRISITCSQVAVHATSIRNKIRVCSIYTPTISMKH